MENLDVNSQVPTNESEADALIASVEGEAPVQQAPQEEQKPMTQAEIKKYELVRRGIKRQFTADEMIPFAQQGWDYAEKMREFNEQRAALITQAKAEAEKSWKEKISGLEQNLSRYRDVDEYIKKDPQWWQFVQDQYQTKLREQGGNTAPLNHPEIEELKTTLKSLVEEREQKQEKERLLQEAERDQKLDSDVAEYREKFPHFDWQQTNNQGHTLEQQILQHAIDHKIGSFKAAANDFLFEEHMKRREVKAKEDTGKEIKKQTKLGLGPVTDKPTQKIERVKNVRGKSYDDLVDEALGELG